jgi:hypothetical protein
MTITIEAFRAQVLVAQNAIVEASGGSWETVKKVRTVWRSADKSRDDCGVEKEVFDVIYKAITTITDLDNQILAASKTMNVVEAKEWKEKTVDKAEAEILARLH